MHPARASLGLVVLLSVLACGGVAEAPEPPAPPATEAPSAEAPSADPPAAPAAPRVVASFVASESSMSDEEFDVWFAETSDLGRWLGSHDIRFMRLGDVTVAEGTDPRNGEAWSIDFAPLRGDRPQGLIAYEVGRDAQPIDVGPYNVDDAYAQLSAYFEGLPPQ